MNKQRLTKITKRELDSAKSGGVLDGTIPELEIRRRLKNQPHQFDVDAILKELSRRVAWARLRGGTRIKRSEVSQQARDTAAVIGELLQRLHVDNMHPIIEGKISELLYAARREFALDVVERINPDLHRLRAALLGAASEMEQQPGRPGPRGDWSAMRDAIAACLRKHSTPRLTAADAKALAADLLKLCGLKSRRKKFP